MTVRHFLMAAAGTVLALAQPSTGRADEVDVFYMTTTTTAGKSFVTKLDGTFRLPMVHVAEGKIKVNYRNLSLGDIEGIRFEKRTETVSAITDVSGGAGADGGDSRIYTLGGQRVDSGRGNLPKGIYIIGKRKVVVR